VGRYDGNGNGRSYGQQQRQQPKARPRTVSELFPSRWLKPEDLQGRACVVEVSEVTFEELRQQNGTTETKGVVWFHGGTRGLILNKTQAWPGVTVRLRPGIAANKKPTILIERAPAPRAAPPAPVAPPDEVDDAADYDADGADEFNEDYGEDEAID
jgi:hypothetical protein